MLASMVWSPGTGGRVPYSPENAASIVTAMARSMAENESWLDPERRLAFETAMTTSLSPVERRLLAGAIVRQLRFNRMVERDLPKYGPAGVVQLTSGRVIGLCMAAVGLLGLPFAWAGVAAVAVCIYTVMGLLLVAVYLRVLSARHSGKRWRSDNVG